MVQEWIRTIQYSLQSAGITLLDTAPWYGHGTSEIVIGWALEDLNEFDRDSIQINTKIGRYEADPAHQFDFSRSASLASVQRSITRMKCSYIDVLQLHDPEFAPSLEELFLDAIPAMIECREKGLCKALGLTGYPLEVQHRIFQRSLEAFGENIWDQALTYGHYNLHDRTLVTQPLGQYPSFLEMATAHNMTVLAAAPLSMGLLTTQGPPDWHPAPPELKTACQTAADICQQAELDIARVALLFALCNRAIPCTILGMKSIEEVKYVQEIAIRVGVAQVATQKSNLLDHVLTDQETNVTNQVTKLFANLLPTGLFQWDGIQCAWNFWEEQGRVFDKWQRKDKAIE